MSGTIDQVEVDSHRLLLFIRENGRDERGFAAIVKSLANSASSQPQFLKDAVLEYVRIAKQHCFGGGCAISLCASANEKVLNCCRKARMEHGEAMVEAKPSGGMTTWGGLHAAPKSNVPETWEEMQKAGSLYGDGHHHTPVVVTNSSTKSNYNHHPAVINRPIQSTVQKPDPVRDKTLEEIESMFGEDAKYDDVIAKSPRAQAEAVMARNKVAVEQKLAKQKMHLSPRNAPVATAPNQPGIPTAKINSVLPETRGGLRVVK